VKAVVVSVFEFSQDVSGEMVLDLAMPGNWLARTGPGVLIPIMTSAVPDEDTSALLDLANQVNVSRPRNLGLTFHAQ